MAYIYQTFRLQDHTTPQIDAHIVYIKHSQCHGTKSTPHQPVPSQTVAAAGGKSRTFSFPSLGNMEREDDDEEEEEGGKADPSLSPDLASTLAKQT